MFKLLKVLGGAVAIALLVPAAASAASISGSGTAIFSNQTNLYGNAGNTVQVSTNFDVPAGQVLHAIETDQVGDFVGPVCHIVSVVEGNQTNVPVAFSEVLSPNANDYGFTMKAFTAATVPQANALNALVGTACTGTNSTVYNQANVVHVLPGGASGGSSGGSISGMSLAQLIEALRSVFGTGGASTTPPVVTPRTSVCLAFDEANAGTQPNVYSDANVALQGFLLSKKMSIPALKAGAAFGFYGNQTTAAVGVFNSIYHCI